MVELSGFITFALTLALTYTFPLHGWSNLRSIAPSSNPFCPAAAFCSFFNSSSAVFLTRFHSMKALKQSF